MKQNQKPNFANRPKHLLQNDSFYFITIRTIEGQWFLKPDKYKQILLEKIKEKVKKFENSLIAYAILNNHDHLLIKVTDAKYLPKMIAEINGASARAINTTDNAINRKIWWNYYDHIIRDEVDFYKHLNYIHQNPIKHSVSDTLGYKFSSYDSWLKIKGKEYLDDCFEKYPIIDFVTYQDEY